MTSYTSLLVFRSAILGALISLTALPAQCFQAPGWVAGPPLPQARNSIDAAADLLGRIYVPGGQNSSGAAMGTLFRFDEPAGTWATLAPMPEPRYGAGVAADALGRIYVIGGYNASGPVATCMRYDPATGQWSLPLFGIAPLPAVRWAGKAVASADGMSIFLLGGSVSPGNSTSTVYRYDVATNTWTTEAPMLRPRVFHGAVLGADGFIYAVGGTQWNTGSPTNGTVERRHPVTGLWSMVSSLINHPHQVGEAVVDAAGRMYVMGGWNPGLSSAVERLDPVTDSWHSCTSLPSGNNNTAAALLPSGRIAIFGGDGPSAAVWFAQPDQFMAAVTNIGPGCPGTSGVPVLASTLPQLGTNVVLTLTSIPFTTAAIIAHGFTNTQWNGVPLPLELGVVGMPGCLLHVNPEISVGNTTTFAFMVSGFSIPNNPSLEGRRIYSQAIVLDPPANPFGAVVSNALCLFIGY